MKDPAEWRISRIGVGQTVAGLLRELDIRTDRVAVELNLKFWTGTTETREAP